MRRDRLAFGTCYLLFWFVLVLQGPARAALLQIDQSHSRIEVVVNSTSGGFTGKLEKYHASIECEPSQLLPSKADVSFDFKDLKTGIQQRDNHLLKWLDYSKNPTGSFHLKNWKEENGDTYAVGELTLHEINKEIRLRMKVTKESDKYQLEGVLNLDHRDFGLPKIRNALVFTVDPHLKIQFRLVGKIEQ